MLTLDAEAVGAALEDAGLSPADVHGMVTFTMDTSPEITVARACGLPGRRNRGGPVVVVTVDGEVLTGSEPPQSADPAVDGAERPDRPLNASGHPLLVWGVKVTDRGAGAPLPVGSALPGTGRRSRSANRRTRAT